MSVRKRLFRLSPNAQRDYDDILLYSFLTWGEAHMERYRAILDRGLIAVGDNPEIGRSHGRPFSGLRSFRVEHRDIYYRVTPEVIEVAHPARAD